MPIRMPDSLHPERLYRSFSFGGVADLHMMDMFYFRGAEMHPDGSVSVLGLHQEAWLQEQLRQSRGTWQLLSNQALMSDWLSQGTPKFIRNRANPHHRWVNFTQHGYFTVALSPEKVEVDVFFVPMNRITNQQKLGKRMTVLAGEGHWER